MTDDQPGTGATLKFDLLQDGQVQVCVLADNHRELPLLFKGSLHETYLLLRTLKTAIDEELDGKLTTLHTKFGNVVRFTREPLETLHRKRTALTPPSIRAKLDSRVQFQAGMKP